MDITVSFGFYVPIWNQVYIFSVLFLVILDASSDCQTAVFTLNGNTGTTRNWDIKVTQYACGESDISGPPGCLQYYTETYGVIQK